MSFEEPKTKPQPVATWQVRVPILTPSALAGAAKARLAAIMAAPAATENFLVIWFKLLGCRTQHRTSREGEYALAANRMTAVSREGNVLRRQKFPCNIY